VYYSNRSAAHAALEQWEEAAKDARKAVQLRPNWAKVGRQLTLCIQL
jgi:stress-induced-phosphoprotein 1